MLNFEPADNYDYAGLDAVERNSCVGCNRKGVAKYYVIPKILFVHLPTTVKQYNCHDILMLCPACRARASPAQLAHVVRNGRCHCLFDRLSQPLSPLSQSLWPLSQSLWLRPLSSALLSRSLSGWCSLK